LDLELLGHQTVLHSLPWTVLGFLILDAQTSVAMGRLDSGVAGCATYSVAGQEAWTESSTLGLGGTKYLIQLMLGRCGFSLQQHVSGGLTSAEVTR